jgi:hypothetical protein
MYRISQGNDQIVQVDSTKQVEPVIRAGKAGRYHIDQIERDPLPSGHSSRRWVSESNEMTRRSRLSLTRGLNRREV